MPGFYVSQRSADLSQWTLGDPLSGVGDIAEAPGSPIETWTRAGFQGTRTFHVAWEHRHDIVKEILGGGDLDGDSFVMHQPLAYSDNVRAYARSVKVDPLPLTQQTATSATDAGDVLVSYPAAVVTVEYGTPTFESGGSHGDEAPYSQSSPVMVTEAFTAGAEFMNMKANEANQLYWDAAQAEPYPMDKMPGQLIRHINWTITFHHVLVFPTAIFLTWPNTVNGFNSTPGVGDFLDYYSPSLSASVPLYAETLLCGSPTLRREWSVYGWGAYEIVLQFQWRREGWQYVLNPETNIWQYLYNSAGAKVPIYPTANYSDVLPVIPVIP